MKFLPLSDLHLEFLIDPFHYLPPKRDDDKETVVLLAGDILLGWDAVDWIERIAPRFKAVCYILGNHEFYHNDFQEVPKQVDALIADAKLDNVHFLNNRFVTIDDTRIIGTTLWNDFNGQDPKSMTLASWRMSDYQVIWNGDKVLRPEDTLDSYQMNVDFLQTELSKKHNGPTVVMTHHLPSFEFISEEFRHEKELNGAYASDLSDIYSKHDIDLWVFGHSHQALTLEMNNTLFVSNARGYPDEVTLGFNDRMRIALEGI